MSKFYRGDRVVVNGKPLRNDVEDVCYFEQFEGKEGQIFDLRVTSEGVLNLFVIFKNGQVGIFYDCELNHVTD